MKNNNPFLGFGYLVKGIKMLMTPGLKRFLMVPFLINILIFALAGWLGYTQFNELMDWLLPEDSWLAYFRWILWPLFAVTILLVTFYTFTAVANLLAAPFNSILAAKVENMVTGKPPLDNREKLSEIIIPTILSELRKLSYFLIRAVPLLLLFLIPGINLFAPLIWVLFSAWFLSLEYADYPMGNHGMTFPQQHKRIKNVRLTALGFGGGVTLMTMIPIVNFIAMPSAVIGATLFWLGQKEKLMAEQV
ncbi:MAG: sulfate transporter CysZ [Chromatiales bacterium]|nr:sulfate transporter CysZ [Chromatiales bacterium]